MATVKTIGRYTTATARAFKGSKNIFCDLDENGNVYVCNGFILCKMTVYEYAATVQKVTCREAGKWAIRNGQQGTPLDVIGLCEKMAKGADYTVERSPMLFDCGKYGYAAGLYSRDGDFAMIADIDYINAFNETLKLKSAGTTAPITVYLGDELLGIIMPIKGNDKQAAAIKAYFSAN